jgi:hypothetical protein
MPLDYSGVYPAPLLRPTYVQCPLVAGYTTARLYSPYDFGGSSPIPPTPDHTVFAVLENTDPNNAAAVAINQTGTEWSLGTRTLSAFGTIVPGGRISVNWVQTQPYLEIACTWGGPAEIRAQITSQMQWSVLGFRKTDPMYPPQLWEANYSAYPAVPPVNVYTVIP